MGKCGLYERAKVVPFGCTDIDDRRINLGTRGAITSCAAGFATYKNVCSENMFASIGAPVGWFMTACQVTCGVTDCS